MLLEFVGGRGKRESSRWWWWWWWWRPWSAGFGGGLISENNGRRWWWCVGVRPGWEEWGRNSARRRSSLDFGARPRMAGSTSSIPHCILSLSLRPPLNLDSVFAANRSWFCFLCYRLFLILFLLQSALDSAFVAIALDFVSVAIFSWFCVCCNCSWFCFCRNFLLILCLLQLLLILFLLQFFFLLEFLPCQTGGRMWFLLSLKAFSFSCFQISGYCTVWKW